MKQGISLDEVRETVQHVAANREDYLAESACLKYHEEEGLQAPNGELFPLTALAEEQLVARFGVPRHYYYRMASKAPRLLAENLQHWMNKEPKRLLLRAVNGHIRAVLSDQFRRLDNDKMLDAVLPAIETVGTDVLSAELTDTRLYLKCVQHGAIELVRADDTLYLGACISNSEVGLGYLQIETFLCRAACTNGMILGKHALMSVRQRHRGNRLDALEIVPGFGRAVASAEDQIVDDAFWQEAREAAASAFDHGRFERLVADVRETTERSLLTPTYAAPMDEELAKNVGNAWHCPKVKC